MAIEKVSFTSTHSDKYACSGNFKTAKGLRLELTLPDEIVITRRKGKTQVSVPTESVAEFYATLNMVLEDIAQNVPGSVAVVAEHC